jgi:hypothetical protein
MAAYMGAALTLGSQSWRDMWGRGFRGIASRLATGVSRLCEMRVSDGMLRLHPSFYRLDMSEMGSASYWHGMILAKLVAYSELSVPWLLHVDELRTQGLLTTVGGTNERGDMVGRCTKARWHVVEAKGRSRPYPATLVQKAKDQAANVTKVSGTTPSTTCACISRLSKDGIFVLLDDPPVRRDGEGRVWIFKGDSFFELYYGGIIKYMAGVQAPVRNVQGTSFSIVPLLPFYRAVFGTLPKNSKNFADAEFGLPTAILRNPNSAPSAVAEFPRTGEGVMIASDGTAVFGVAGDWETSEAQTRQRP